MLKRDFILRMIEEIAKFVTLVLKLRDTGETEKAYEEIKTMTGKFTGISYDELIKGETGGGSLSVKGSDRVEYLDAKGQFFFTAGEVCLDLGKRKEAQRLFETALFFYNSAENNHKSFSFQRQVDMTKIYEYLDSMAAP
ncbi:MAG: hypothetical protein GXO47_01780 [Chlorobi bacterium]|nr:hypothetical protein [Chlorobiota bacterium]